MASIKSIEYSPVNAAPVKSFFVRMLTRDIALEEAIMDLLDNCVDGILRSKRGSKFKKPYDGFKAEISFNKDSFSITDNCGGIPWGLHDYAFRMGRPEGRPKDAKGSVGVYGIGMKRAIFKMGRDCLISTQNGKHCYDVQIKPEWIDDEVDWQLPVETRKKSMSTDGTVILIGDLYKDIADRFSRDAEDFGSGLKDMIRTHYAFIIEKGFSVGVNGEEIKPRPTKLVFSEEPGPGIAPFIYKTRTPKGVEVFLTVGFTRPLPGQAEIDAEEESRRYSTLGAGWTILCNDRAVVYCDRTELTGWGDASIPQYHTQFIAISGIVEFRSEDPLLLPTTTTKRGINASSALYSQVKNKMREGMSIFIDYTNKWKGSVKESKTHIDKQRTMTFEEIKDISTTLKLTATTKFGTKGEQYRPKLPMPKSLPLRKRKIAFTKDISAIKRVSEFFFNESDRDPSLVGERCFDEILKETME